MAVKGTGDNNTEKNVNKGQDTFDKAEGLAKLAVKKARELDKKIAERQKLGAKVKNSDLDSADAAKLKENETDRFGNENPVKKDNDFFEAKQEAKAAEKRRVLSGSNLNGKRAGALKKNNPALKTKTDSNSAQLKNNSLKLKSSGTIKNKSGKTMLDLFKHAERVSEAVQNGASKVSVPTAIINVVKGTVKKVTKASGKLVPKGQNDSTTGVWVTLGVAGMGIVLLIAPILLLFMATSKPGVVSQTHIVDATLVADQAFDNSINEKIQLYIDSGTLEGNAEDIEIINHVGVLSKKQLFAYLYATRGIEGSYEIDSLNGACLYGSEFGTDISTGGGSLMKTCGAFCGAKEDNMDDWEDWRNGNYPGDADMTVGDIYAMYHAINEMYKMFIFPITIIDNSYVNAEGETVVTASHQAVQIEGQKKTPQEMIESNSVLTDTQKENAVAFLNDALSDNPTTGEGQNFKWLWYWILYREPSLNVDFSNIFVDRALQEWMRTGGCINDPGGLLGGRYSNGYQNLANPSNNYKDFLSWLSGISPDTAERINYSPIIIKENDIGYWASRWDDSDRSEETYQHYICRKATDGTYNGPWCAAFVTYCATNGGLGYFTYPKAWVLDADSADSDNGGVRSVSDPGLLEMDAVQRQELLSEWGEAGSDLSAEGGTSNSVGDWQRGWVSYISNGDGTITVLDQNANNADLDSGSCQEGKLQEIADYIIAHKYDDNIITLLNYYIYPWPDADGNAYGPLRTYIDNDGTANDIYRALYNDILTESDGNHLDTDSGLYQYCVSMGKYNAGDYTTEGPDLSDALNYLYSNLNGGQNPNAAAADAWGNYEWFLSNSYTCSRYQHEMAAQYLIDQTGSIGKLYLYTDDFPLVLMKGADYPDIPLFNNNTSHVSVLSGSGDANASANDVTVQLNPKVNPTDAGSANTSGYGITNTYADDSYTITYHHKKGYIVPDFDGWYLEHSGGAIYDMLINKGSVFHGNFAELMMTCGINNNGETPVYDLLAEAKVTKYSFFVDGAISASEYWNGANGTTWVPSQDVAEGAPIETGDLFVVGHHQHVGIVVGTYTNPAGTECVVLVEGNSGNKVRLSVYTRAAFAEYRLQAEGGLVTFEW